MNWWKSASLETIEAAALKGQDGKVYSVPKPGRHHTVIMDMKDKGIDRETRITATQGFITSSGRFVDRLEGAEIALKSGQIKALRWPPDLYSEDLW